LYFRRSGKPCVRGLGITVYEVLEYLSSDMTEAEIYHRRIHGMFLDILLYKVDIRKHSTFCLTGVDYMENVSIISIWATEPKMKEGSL